MSLCVVSFKECWTDSAGTWYSDGGFPLQVTALAGLFEQTTLMITRSQRKDGGIELPKTLRVVTMPTPPGRGIGRKIAVILALPLYLTMMAREIRRVDAVYIPLPGDLPFLGMLVALGLGKNIIGRYGGSWVVNDQSTIATRFMRWMMRAVAGGRNLMLATGMGNEPPAPRMHWLFSTVLTRKELEEIHPDLDRGLSQPPNFVYIGRLSPEKGVTTLVKAMARLRDERFAPMPHITLIGDGPQRESLENLIAEQGLGEWFTLTGQLDRSALSRWLLKADLAVQPSLTEGLSKAWLDAMAHGLPVIASNVGVAEQVIGANQERGWLVVPGDVENLQSTIRNVIQNSIPWSAMRARCRQFVEGLTLEAWQERIAELCVQQWGWKYRDGKIKNE